LTAAKCRAGETKTQTQNQLAWDYFLDWLGYRFPRIRPLLRPSPSLLIKDGHIQRHNLRREMITAEELIEQLREQGVESVEEIKQSYMEGDGRISVITKDSKDKKGERQKTFVS
jgi:uncharacterized membrane protein YcaP (DUF421 family)